MLSLEREVLAAPIGGEAKGRIVAIERREIVSLRVELRALLWIGVALISGGAGVLLAENIERIGHVTLIAAIFAAAAACYFFAWRSIRRNGPAQPVPTGQTTVSQEPGAGGTPAPHDAGTIAQEPGAGGTPAPHEAAAPHVVGEYLLLLGALLLSADVAYAEAQLKILGEGWRWHLLILAAIHGGTAYAFGSRKVLSLAIVALAGLFGVDRSGEIFSAGPGDAAARLAMAAASLALWRIVHERASGRRSFDFPLEQAAFHLAMLASIVAIFDESLRWLGLAAALILAALGALHAWRTREESFLVFAILYAVVAIDAAVILELSAPRMVTGWLTITTPLAIAALYIVHRRWKERPA